ncbi:MAG: PEP-CTERM sorting domain-containing protein [Planctomycetes bacterium]|nr:PEP-CTERM sorting domain-containing protein [Planctomycetota bacterium]MBC8310557.1 PEP-CTERM sorting domain-containing protein [Planctomycetota bacterium]
MNTFLTGAAVVLCCSANSFSDIVNYDSYDAWSAVAPSAADGGGFEWGVDDGWHNSGWNTNGMTFNNAPGGFGFAVGIYDYYPHAFEETAGPDMIIAPQGSLSISFDETVFSFAMLLREVDNASDWTMDMYQDGVLVDTVTFNDFIVGETNYLNFTFDSGFDSVEITEHEDEWEGYDAFGGFYYSTVPGAIPAPSALALLGLAGVATRRRRK